MDKYLRILQRQAKSGDVDARTELFQYCLARGFLPKDIVIILAALDYEPAKLSLSVWDYTYVDAISAFYSLDREAAICVAQQIVNRAILIDNQAIIPDILLYTNLCLDEKNRWGAHAFYENLPHLIKDAIFLLEKLGRDCDLYSKRKQFELRAFSRQEESPPQELKPFIEVGLKLRQMTYHISCENSNIDSLLLGEKDVIRILDTWSKVLTSTLAISSSYQISETLQSLCSWFDLNFTWRRKVWVEEILSYYLFQI